MSEVPIKNIYYLLCYAWEQMEAGKITEAGATGHTKLQSLFAGVLIRGTKRVLTQGLDQEYVPTTEETQRPRGKIDFQRSVRRGLLPQGKVHCRYDELSQDALHNRILKSTLRHLARTDGVDDELQGELKVLTRRFKEVSDVPLRRSLFSQIQLHSNNAFYRFLLQVCSLVVQNLVPQENDNGYRFRDFLRDEATMYHLFENFVFNFYDAEQDRYAVDSPHIEWDVIGDPPKTLPNMRTDVVLKSQNHTVIIDTKYTTDSLTTHHGTDLYKSNHLYQLFAYLQNAEAMDERYDDAEGILLYPTAGTHLADSFEVRGHVMRLCTLDLSQEWPDIEEDLLSLL